MFYDSSKECFCVFFFLGRIFGIASILFYGGHVLAEGPSPEHVKETVVDKGIPLDTVEFESATLSVREGAGQVILRVFRIPSMNGGGDLESSGVVTVNFATSDGTAQSGIDYEKVEATLTWQDGETGARTVTIPIKDDEEADGDKTVDLTLSNPVGAVLGRSTATLTILDEESLACVAGANTLCLNENGRFKVEMDFESFDGSEGPAGALYFARDSGFFYFFDPGNIELMIKVLNGCADNGNYWVFFAATTNVGFELRVTDTQAGVQRVYRNYLGVAAQTVLENRAFETCP